MAKKEAAKLHAIHIKLHHGGEDGALHDGFEIEHHHSDGSVTPMGVTHHHGEVIHHVHEHTKHHGGGDGEIQEELSGGGHEGHKELPGEVERESGCVLCDGGGEHEVKGAHLSNVAYHGYEKHSVNAPGHSAAHPGFKAVQNKIAGREHLSQKAAGAILASRTRHASKAAHKANPRLNRVKG